MSDKPKNGNGASIPLQGMYRDYFLDYASYVILERAVPSVVDGLKPVQRRILHSMKQMDDGRFHKVANIIGQTMQYHPHGDAAIGEALINLGQKDLLIDCQGNWGDIRTGDSAAAPRYIEARLSKFALDIAFNHQTTEWQLSYDGRKNEPVNLPVKFPLLLAQGAEGIAVGLSTKILPHNFIELCHASIEILKGKKAQIFPDFQTGGSIDVADYDGGRRGGRVKVRSSIEIVDKKFLAIRELPYGVTTESLIDSIIKANEKGKIKIKKVTDNTAADVEILVELIPGASPEVTIDALYAFTNCEFSISPNACVIIDDKPRFFSVEEMLEINVRDTKNLLELELQILQRELQEKWLFASLEKIFIEKRIYRDIEECETWEAVIETIDKGLRKYVLTPGQKTKPDDQRVRLLRDITTDDIARLTEIKIKRISKFNSFQADELIAELEKQLLQVQHDLDHLTDYAIAWFKRLLDKYGKGRERKTRITTIEKVEASEVVASNAKLYANFKDGFIGYGLKKDEFIADCSDIDDVIVFRRDGKFVVTRIAEKTFVGKDIIHAAVWKKNDERTTYHLIYLDGKTGRSFAKRFNVTAITRDREYDLTQGSPHSKILYFSVQPNGESELLSVQLSPSSKAKIKQFEYGFADLAIKSRSAQGNIVTKYPVRNISQKERGQSTLSAIKIWMDEASGRLNTDGRGRLLGEFDSGDTILAVFHDGSYEMTDYQLTHRFNPEELIYIGKFDPELVVSAVHFDGQKGWTLVKRFRVETTSLQQRFSFLTEHNQSKLLYASVKPQPKVQYTVQVKSKRLQGMIDLSEFIDVKGWKAQGNKLSDRKLTQIKEVEDIAPEAPKLHAGDTVEFDVEDNGQTKLF